MSNGKNFTQRLKDNEFIVTAEYMPGAAVFDAVPAESLNMLKAVPCAVNVADNPSGISMSSMAASLLLSQNGVEPIYQVVTRDRNRIAIQSDILGAASLGIKNILCLSGYHQVLTDNPESANVYDIDSTQLVSMVKRMKEKGELLNGVKIDGSLSMSIGAVTNPYLRPMALNMLRLSQKVDAGVDFIQTHAVFDIDAFSRWMDAVNSEGISGRTAVIAGVFPLESAAEAEELAAKYTDFNIPAAVIERLKSAGDSAAQRKEGIAIFAETAAKIKSVKGLRGIHIFSGGKESIIPEVLSASGLSGN